MPRINPNLDVNVFVSISKRFITDEAVKAVLTSRDDWNTPRLTYKGKTISKFEANGKVMYEVQLDAVSDHIIKVSQGALKYLGPVTTEEQPVAPIFREEVEIEDLLDDAVPGDLEEEQEEVDLTATSG